MSVVQTGSTLTIMGDALPQNVVLYESDAGASHQTLVSVDANGNGTFTDPGDVNGAIYKNVTSTVVRLAGGNDSLKIILADPFAGATRKYDIRTGEGNNSISFINPVGNDIRDSSVSLAVQTGSGTDKVSLDFNRIVNSKVSANVSTGDGNDTLTLIGGDKVVNSTVTVNADLGAGNDVMNQTLDWEGFGLLGATSAWHVAVNGNDGNDTLNATGQLGGPAAAVAGLLDINYTGGNGNDNINFALDQFSLRGGTLRLRDYGSAGDDVLSLSGNIGSGGVGGLIDVLLNGGMGNDTLRSSTNSDPLNHYAPASGAIFDGGAGTNSGTIIGTLLATRLRLVI